MQVLIEIASDLPDHVYHLMLLRCCKAVLWEASQRLDSLNCALNILSNRCKQFCNVLPLHCCKAGIWHQLKLLMVQLLSRQALLLKPTKLCSEACAEVWLVICQKACHCGRWNGPTRGKLDQELYDIARLHAICILVRGRCGMYHQ